MQVIKLDSLNLEEVNLKEFLRIYREERDDIDSAEIIPPKLGEEGFGKILLRRKVPIYKVKLGQSEHK